MLSIMIGTVLPMLLQITGRNVRFSAGAQVFRTGDEVKNINVILKGRINLVRHPADGSALVLQRAEAGAILAKASLYTPGYHCDANAEMDSSSGQYDARIYEAASKRTRSFAKVGRGISPMMSKKRGCMQRFYSSRPLPLASIHGSTGMVHFPKKADG